MRINIAFVASGAISLLGLFLSSCYGVPPMSSLAPQLVPQSVAEGTQATLNAPCALERSPGVFEEKLSKSAPLPVVKGQEEVAEQSGVLCPDSKPYYPKKYFENYHSLVISKPGQLPTSLPQIPMLVQNWPTIGTPVAYLPQHCSTPSQIYGSFLMAPLPVADRQPWAQTQAWTVFSPPAAKAYETHFASPAQLDVAGSQLNWSASENTKTSDDILLISRIFGEVPKDVLGRVTPLLFPFKYQLEKNHSKLHTRMGSFELSKRFYYLENFQGYTNMRETSAKEAIQGAIECGTLMRNSIYSIETMKLYMQEFEEKTSQYDSLKSCISESQFFYASILLAAAADQLYHDFQIYVKLIEIMKDSPQVRERGLERELAKINRLSAFAKEENPSLKHWLEDQRVALGAILAFFFRGGETKKIIRVCKILRALVVTGPTTDCARSEVLNLIRKSLDPILNLYQKFQEDTKPTVNFLRGYPLHKLGVSVHIPICSVDEVQLSKLMDLYIVPTSRFKKRFLIGSQDADIIMKKISKVICDYAEVLGKGVEARGVAELTKVYGVDHLKIYQGSEHLFDSGFDHIHQSLSTWTKAGRPNPHLIYF